MTDRYTKIVLTVIAVALSVIAARGLMASAVAQGPALVFIAGVAPAASNSPWALPVKIRN
jgi:hypothetical protein